MQMTQAIKELVDKITNAGGKPYFVGGAVRDWIASELASVVPKDLDIEVFGLTEPQLKSLMETEDRATFVGKSFGVFKLKRDGIDIDISLPRAEKKVGDNRQDFEVEFDPFMSISAAARRRDYTINAIMFDPNKREILDPYYGAHHLKNKKLIHVSHKTFAEDELRVLRGMQFCGRFNLEPDRKTISLCQSLVNDFDKLPVERIREEWVKWALKSQTPSKGIDFLLKTGWLQKFRQFAPLNGTIQDPEWHPEGDAFVHSILASDVMRNVLNREEVTDIDDQLSLMFGALCHDIGKPNTTETREDGRITSYNHAPYGAPIAVSFLTDIGFTPKVTDKVFPLVREHMCHITWRKNMPSAKALRRAAVRLAPATIEELFYIFEADVWSRPPLQPEDELVEVMEKARNNGVFKGIMQPLIKGRHVLEALPNRKPGPWVGRFVKAANEAQIEERFKTEGGGISWIKREAAHHPSQYFIEKSEFKDD